MRTGMGARVHFVSILCITVSLGLVLGGASAVSLKEPTSNAKSELVPPPRTIFFVLHFCVIVASVGKHFTSVSQFLHR